MPGLRRYRTVRRQNGKDPLHGCAASLDDGGSNGIRGLLSANVAAVLAGGTGFIAYVGWSYYATLFEQFGLQPSVLDISQTERIFMGWMSVFGLAIESIGSRQFIATLVGGCLAISAMIAIAMVGEKRGWRWAFAVRHSPRAPDFVDGLNRWMLRIGFVSVLMLIAFDAGSYAGRWNARAYRARVAHGLGCSYGFGTETLHGVLLGQDRVRTLLLTADGVRLVNNSALRTVEATSTACLDSSNPPSPSAGSVASRPPKQR